MEKTRTLGRVAAAILIGCIALAALFALLSQTTDALPTRAPKANIPQRATAATQESTSRASNDISLSPDRWYHHDWPYRRAVAISHTCGVSLPYIQVEIALDENFPFTQTLPGGEDIRVTDGDGETPLPFWIERWNRIHYFATIWVRAPINSNTIYLYYGNPDPPEPDIVEVPPTGPWEKDTDNPIVPIGDPGNGDSLLAENIVYDAETGHYWLVFANYRNGSVGLAWSDDPGDPTTWHWHGDVVASANAPHIVEHEGTWYIFYADRAHGGPPYPISVSTADTISGTYTYTSTVLTSTESWEAYRVDEPYVFQRSGGDWVLLYMGDAGDTTEQIGYATAPDILGPYTKYAGNPVLDFGPPGSLDAGTVADPWAVEFEGTTYIGYTASSTKHHPWRTTYATTTDWISFTKSYEVILDLGTPGTWDEDNAFRGAVTRFGDTYYFPYTGATASPYVYRMGIATQPAFITETLNDPHQVFAFYDDFQGTTLDPGRWTVGYEGAGGTLSVGNGVLTLTGQAGTSSGYIQLWGTPRVPTGTLMETRARHPDAGAGAGPEETNTAGELGYKLDEDWDDLVRMMDYPDMTYYTINAISGGVNSDYVSTGVTFDTEWHTYRIHRTLSGTVTFQLDDHPADALGPPYVPTIDLPPWLMSYARTPVTQSHFLVDYIRVRQWCGVEPTTIVNEEERALFISKAASADPVIPGAALIYTLTYRHLTTETLPGVLITDVLDSHVDFVGATPAPSGGTVYTPTWSIGSLSGPVTGTIVLTVTVPPTLPGGTQLVNVATIASDETAPRATVLTTTVAAVTLDITQTDAPDPVVSGASLVYTLIYTNTGDVPVTEVVITDVLDSDVIFTTAYPTPSGGAGQERTWEIAALPPFSSSRIIVSATVQGGLSEDTVVTNTVSIASLETSPVTVREETRVLSHTTAASITLAPATAILTAGRSLSYTLTASDAYGNAWDVSAETIYSIDESEHGGIWAGNVYTAHTAGPWTVRGIYGTLSDTASLVVEPGPAHSITLAPEEVAIAAGDTQVYTATAFDAYGNRRGDVTPETAFSIDEANHGGTWVDNAYTTATPGTWTVRGTYDSTLSGTASLNVIAPSLSLEKDDGVTTVEAGDRLTYTITFANIGDTPAYDVVITDTLPDHTHYVGCAIASGTCNLVSAGMVRFEAGSLATEASGTATVVVEVDDPLSAGAEIVANHAQITALSGPVPVTAEDVDEIVTRPDLSLAVSQTPSLFSPGRPLTYTITYSNTGRMDAADVVITATLPSSITYAGEDWISVSDQTYIRAVGDLPAGVLGNQIPLSVEYPDGEQIASSMLDATFAIGGARGIAADVDPEDNDLTLSTGVPDLVVTHFDVGPLPLQPGTPVVFTVTVKNQGTGMAWNPDNESGFYLDIFVAPVPSYPWERDSEKGIYHILAPIAPGKSVTTTIFHTGFSEQEIEEELRAFYVKIDNHFLYPYGLVPEANEWNNCGEPVLLYPHAIYLPVIMR